MALIAPPPGRFRPLGNSDETLIRMISSPVHGLWGQEPSDLSACGARGAPRDWPDVGEHAAGIPGGEGSYQRREAVELDAAFARGLGPGELAGVPLDEGFGFRRDVEILVEAGVRLADLGISALDKQPVTFTARAAAPTFAHRAPVGKEVEADDEASIREPVSAERAAHRPQGYKGVEVLRGDLEPTGTPLAERLAHLEKVVACRRELVVVPAPVGLGR